MLFSCFLFSWGVGLVLCPQAREHPAWSLCTRLPHSSTGSRHRQVSGVPTAPVTQPKTLAASFHCMVRPKCTFVGHVPRGVCTEQGRRCGELCPDQGLERAPDARLLERRACLIEQTPHMRPLPIWLPRGQHARTIAVPSSIQRPSVPQTNFRGQRP